MRTWHKFLTFLLILSVSTGLHLSWLQLLSLVFVNQSVYQSVVKPICSYRRYWTRAIFSEFEQRSCVFATPLTYNFFLKQSISSSALSVYFNTRIFTEVKFFDNVFISISRLAVNIFSCIIGYKLSQR